MRVCLRGFACAFLLILGIGLLTPALARNRAEGEEVWRLRSVLRCGGTEFRLAELLLEGDPGTLGERVVGQSPRPGQRRDLSRERLRRLLADWGWQGRLEGPERLNIRTPGIELAGAPLEAAVSQRLDSLLSARGLAREDAPTGWPESLVFASVQLHWDLRIPPNMTGPTGRADLTLRDAAGFETRIDLRYRCVRPVRVALSAAALSAGESPDQWEWAQRNAFVLDGDPLHEEELAAAVARRAIRVGEALTRHNLKPAPLVHAGREVTIQLERGSVRVSLKGIARGDGALGDLVPVRPLDRRELVRYRVTGPGTVAPAYLDDNPTQQGDRS